MEVDLLRLKLMIAASLGAAACCAFFLFQRGWYRWRIRTIDCVERLRFRIYPEGVVAVVTVVLAWFGLAGLLVVHDLRGFVPLSQAGVLCDIEVGATEAEGVTLLAYDRIDPEVPEAGRLRGVLVARGTDFVIEFQRANFGPLTTLLAQGELVRVRAVRPDRPQRDPSRIRRRAAGANTLVLSPTLEGGGLLWPFLRSVEEDRLSLSGVTSGQVYAVEVDGSGGLSLRLRPPTRLPRSESATSHSN